MRPRILIPFGNSRDSPVLLKGLVKCARIVRLKRNLQITPLHSLPINTQQATEVLTKTKRLGRLGNRASRKIDDNKVRLGVPGRRLDHFHSQILECVFPSASTSNSNSTAAPFSRAKPGAAEL